MPGTARSPGLRLYEVMAHVASEPVMAEMARPGPKYSVTETVGLSILNQDATIRLDEAHGGVLASPATDLSLGGQGNVWVSTDSQGFPMYPADRRAG